jgi:restriction endonuclease S subunit
MILSSNLCAIRLKADSPISPALLQTWLESPAGLGQLQMQSQGSSILNLRPKGLGEIQIPLPTAQQAQTLNALAETYRISINSARSALESRQKIALSVIQQAFEKAALNG